MLLVNKREKLTGKDKGKETEEMSVLYKTFIVHNKVQQSVLFFFSLGSAEEGLKICSWAIIIHICDEVHKDLIAVVIISSYK